MFRKKLLNSYTLAEVVIVMLIIAVIVAVSIRITKAKLDKVITYSAYSTLSSVAESMASDIRNKRVDEEYLTLKYFIEDMKLGFRNNIARLRTFFAYNFVPPAYAYSLHCANGSWCDPWRTTGWKNQDYRFATNTWDPPKKAYDCQAEHYFNSDICNPDNNSSNYYIISGMWGGATYEQAKDSYVHSTFAAACWDASHYLYNNHSLPAAHTGVNSSSECKLNNVNFIPGYESGEVTLYHCGFENTGTPKAAICDEIKGSYGSACVYGYDISGEDYFTKDEFLSSSKSYNFAPIYPTCGQDAKTSWAKTSCGQAPGRNAPSACTRAYMFGRAKDFIELRNKYAKECRLPHDVGLNSVHNYIYDHGAGEHDISGENYYVRLNQYTYSGTCYYAARKCEKTQILGGVGYIGADPLTKEVYERDPGTYIEKVVCIERPCDFFDTYFPHAGWGNRDPHAAYGDELLPDYCQPDPPSGGGGGGSVDPVDPDPIEPEPDDPEPIPPDEPDCDLNPANAPCGQELDEESCSYVEKEGFSRDCPEGKTWDETICGCQENDDSFTGNGAKFCELFETYLNKKGGTSVCSGNGIASNTTDFTGKKPDLILRNGIAIYNLSANDAAVIPELVTVNVVESEDMSDENREILNNQKGYIIYADVDGQNNGDSKLWEDVYPFYITLSGKVIPVFDKTANPDGSGGDSVNHLQMNVVRKRFQQRGLRWVAQGVSFQEAACRSGYIDFRAPYCDGYQIDPGCNINSNNVSSCKLKPVKPIGFFF